MHVSAKMGQADAKGMRPLGRLGRCSWDSLIYSFLSRINIFICPENALFTASDASYAMFMVTSRGVTVARANEAFFMAIAPRQFTPLLVQALEAT